MNEGKKIGVEVACILGASLGLLGLARVLGFLSQADAEHWMAYACVLAGVVFANFVLDALGRILKAQAEIKETLRKIAANR